MAKKLFKITKHQTAHSMNDFCQHLRSEGWEFAGEGAFGRVYTKEGLALKVGKTSINKAYLSWVKAVQKIGQHENAPRIYAASLYECEAYYDYFAVVMEALEESQSKRKNGIMPKEIDSWYQEFRTEARIAVHELRRGAIQSNVREIIKHLAVAVGKKNCLDLHYGNIMFRGNTPVITDPVC